MLKTGSGRNCALSTTTQTTYLFLRYWSREFLNCQQEKYPVFRKNYLLLIYGISNFMQRTGQFRDLSFYDSWYRKYVAPSFFYEMQIMCQGSLSFSSGNRQFTVNRWVDRSLGSRGYFGENYGRGAVNPDSLGEFPDLFRIENENLSFDLKFEMRMANSRRLPITTSISCFFLSWTLDPRNRNNATKASTAAMITIDKLCSILQLQTIQLPPFQSQPKFLPQIYVPRTIYHWIIG